MKHCLALAAWMQKATSEQKVASKPSTTQTQHPNPELATLLGLALNRSQLTTAERLAQDKL